MSRLLVMLVVIGLLAMPGAPAAAKSQHDHQQRVTVEEARQGVGAQVVGGKKVPGGTYTFMAFVQIDVGGGFFVQCGGTLIDPRFVLTAAHCVQDEDGNRFDPSQYLLAIGRVNLNNIGPENVFGVVDVSQDPDWDPETLTNDAAVLELDEAVPSSIATPLPIVAAGDTEFDSPGQAVGVAGWGLTSGHAEQTPDVLREANLNVVSDATCDATFGDINGAVVICAAKKGKSSCQGDSGGPLFVPEGAVARSGAVRHHDKERAAKAERRKHHKRRHKKHRKKKGKVPTPAVQIGIVSFGAMGCPTGIPGGYTRLSAPAINDFITGVVGS